MAIKSFKDFINEELDHVRHKKVKHVEDHDPEDSANKEAEANAESDKERRAEVETRNQGEALVHGAEKAIDDLGDKADPQAKTEVEAGIEALREALDGDDMEAISSKSAELSKVMMKMGEAAYQAEADADGNAGEASDDESVVDAEFEEVDADSDDGKKKSK